MGWCSGWVGDGTGREPVIGTADIAGAVHLLDEGLELGVLAGSLHHGFGPLIGLPAHATGPGGYRGARRRAWASRRMAAWSRRRALFSGSRGGGRSGFDTPACISISSSACAPASWPPSRPPQIGHFARIRTSIRPTVAGERGVPV